MWEFLWGDSKGSTADYRIIRAVVGAVDARASEGAGQARVDAGHEVVRVQAIIMGGHRRQGHCAGRTVGVTVP